MILNSYPEAIRYMPMIVKALLSHGGSAKAAVVKDWIAKKLVSEGLSVPEETLKSGGLKFPNDIQWGRLYLIKAGLLETKDNSGYGIWKLTGNGWTSKLDEDAAKAIYDSVSKKKSTNATCEDPAPEQLEIEQTVDWRKQLSDIITKMEAGKFETLCLRIMMESGFEPHKVQSHSNANTPDGGIDGEGMLSFGDKSLVKIKVAWQCKRFKESSVGAQVVRDFRGSIDGKTQYGIIFTSSVFSQSAIAEAKRPGATPIELFDLEKMIDLLKEREMGVETRPIVKHETTVDPQYFDNIGSYTSLIASIK